MNNQQMTYQPRSQVLAMSDRLSIEPAEMQDIIMNTIMPAKVNVTNEQFVSFLAVANEYQLNPLTKEIYAFPAKGGGVQAIVSIDGWLKIINQHPDFDGLEHEDILDNGKLLAIKCRIYRKSTSRPVEVAEYMEECRQGTSTWQKWPARMLRHKATIQAARYAFGLSGIIDPDEAERYEQQGVINSNEKDVTPTKYPEVQFNKNFPKWVEAIQSGELSAEDVISKANSKYPLSKDQQDMILGVAA